MRSIFAIVLLLAVATHACAVELGYSFSGSVTQKFSNPYGASIEANAPVNGRFIYDTDSSASHPRPTCDCDGYRQQITGGFSAYFGPIHVRADDYVVEVSNDFPQPLGNVLDFVTVAFSSSIYDPAPTAPINVDGNAFPTGEFHLIFVGNDDDLFHDTELPTSIDLNNDFSSEVNLINESSTGFPDIQFEITSLDSFPVVTGDYDFDGVVDAADYSVWKSLLGSTTDLAADGNRDGVVDAADFTVWRDAAASVAAANVPEPAFSYGWTILLWGAVLVLTRERS